MTRDDITLPKEVIEQLLKTLKNSAHWSRLYYGSREVGDAIQDLEFALAAEQPSEDIEALRRDAERYRWACDHVLAIDLAADPDNFAQVWVGTDPARVFRGKTLDDAIDAAKKAAPRREEDQ